MIVITQKNTDGLFVDGLGNPIQKTGNVLFHESETQLIIFFTSQEHKECLENNVPEES